MAFGVLVLADFTTDGGWLIQTFVFPTGEDIWFPLIVHSNFDVHQVSSRAAGREDATRKVEAGRVFR